MMKSLFNKKFHTDERGYSLIELVVVIAIMVALVAIAAPMLYNGPSNKTKQDVSTFDSLIAKNAVMSMAQQNRAMELAYDGTNCYVATGVLTEPGGSSTTYSFGSVDDIRTFDSKETISYYLYGGSEPSHSGDFLSHSAASTDSSNYFTLTPDRKIYFRLDKTKGNFKSVIITDSAGNLVSDSDYVKYVYFNISNVTRGCRLYKDTGKHDVFKE